MICASLTYLPMKVRQKKTLICELRMAKTFKELAGLFMNILFQLFFKVYEGDHLQCHDFLHKALLIMTVYFKVTHGEELKLLAKFYNRLLYLITTVFNIGGKCHLGLSHDFHFVIICLGIQICFVNHSPDHLITGILMQEIYLSDSLFESTGLS